MFVANSMQNGALLVLFRRRFGSDDPRAGKVVDVSSSISADIIEPKDVPQELCEYVGVEDTPTSKPLLSLLN